MDKTKHRILSPVAEEALKEIKSMQGEIDRLREVLQTIRLATCDYTVGARASLESVHKLATDALVTPNVD